MGLATVGVIEIAVFIVDIAGVAIGDTAETFLVEGVGAINVKPF